MPIIEVKSGQYKVSSTLGELLVTEHLGADIAFSIFDIKLRKVLLARNIEIDTVTSLFDQFKREGEGGSYAPPPYLLVQIVGGQDHRQMPYFEALMKTFVKIVGDTYKTESHHGFFRITGDNYAINIYGTDILEKDHPDSISVGCALGRVNAFNSDIRAAFNLGEELFNKRASQDMIAQKKSPLDGRVSETELVSQKSEDDTESNLTDCSSDCAKNSLSFNENQEVQDRNKSSQNQQNDNSSLETNYNSGSYHIPQSNYLLSQLQDQIPNTTSLELDPKLTAPEVQNDQKQETEDRIAEILLSLENQQVTVKIPENLNIINETIWDDNGLNYIHQLGAIYKPKSTENTTSLPANSIISSDLFPKIDPVAFLGTFTMDQKHAAGVDLANLGFAEAMLL